MFKRDCTTSLNFINYSTFNSEHNWKDLRIQQTRIRDYHKITAFSISYMIFVDVVEHICKCNTCFKV